MSLPIVELEMCGVYDRGVPNKERVGLRAILPLNLRDYVMMIGVTTGTGGAWPLIDSALWLGDMAISPPCWIFVFTGPGETLISQENFTSEPAHAIHWGRKRTIFDDPKLIPILLRIDAVEVGDKPGKRMVDLIGSERFASLVYDKTGGSKP